MIIVHNWNRDGLSPDKLCGYISDISSEDRLIRPRDNFGETAYRDSGSKYSQDFGKLAEVINNSVVELQTVVEPSALTNPRVTPNQLHTYG